MTDEEIGRELEHRRPEVLRTVGIRDRDLREESVDAAIVELLPQLRRGAVENLAAYWTTCARRIAAKLTPRETATDDLASAESPEAPEATEPETIEPVDVEGTWMAASMGERRQWIEDPGARRMDAQERTRLESDPRGTALVDAREYAAWLQVTADFYARYTVASQALAQLRTAIDQLRYRGREKFVDDGGQRLEALVAKLGPTALWRQALSERGDVYLRALLAQILAAPMSREATEILDSMEEQLACWTRPTTGRIAAVLYLRERGWQYQEIAELAHGTDALAVLLRGARVPTAGALRKLVHDHSPTEKQT
jgi:hypothetical protein